MSEIRKLLTLDDLYAYYVNNNKNVTFSADKEHTQIFVQLPAKLSFKKSGKDIEGLMPVHLQANHTGTNRNGSHIEDNIAEQALPSFCNRPILGYIHKVNDQWEFWGHNMHEDDEGNLEYDEVPVGVIPESCGAKLVYDKEKGRTYVEVDGYIYEEYSHAAEILEREEQCDVSVELAIRDLAYNAKEKYLDIKDYYYSGVTILGCDDEGVKINPGMEGSDVKLADFSAENNSTINDISEKLDNFFNKISSLFNNNIDSTKGGNSQVNKFEELLEKYGKAVEDIKFEYEGLSDEELEAAFAEAFTENEESNEGNDTVETTETNETDENTIDTVDEETESETDDTVSETDACGGQKKKKKCSEEENESEDLENTDETDDIVSEDEACGGSGSKKKKKNNDLEENFTKAFSISHEDIRSALYTLLATYEESDNDWYYIESVYDDHFDYSGMFTNNIFGQKYTKDGDNVAFDGERYSLHRELLTDSEYAELKSMRENYSALVQYKADNELQKSHAEKENVMNNEKYSMISKKNENGEYVNDSYKELYSNMDKYSCEELEEKLKAIVGEFALSGGNFSVENKENNTGKVSLPMNTKAKKKSRYGDLFEGILNK